MFNIDLLKNIYKEDTEIVEKLNGLNDDELQLLKSVMEFYNCDVGSYDLVGMHDVLKDMEDYIFIEGVYNLRDLGMYVFNSTDRLDSMTSYEIYIDYEKYGRDIQIEQGGYFVNNGYLYCEV